MFTWGCHSLLRHRTQRQGCCVLCLAHLSTFSPAPPENRSTARCLWFGLSVIWNFAGCFSFKDTREGSCTFFFTQIVSSTGRSQQCWSLACPSHLPSHLQLENLLSAHQGNSPVAQSSAFWDNLLSHQDWGTSINIVDKKKYPRVRMSHGQRKANTSEQTTWQVHMKERGGGYGCRNQTSNNASVHSFSETSDFHVKVFQLAHSHRSTGWVQCFLLIIFLPRLSARRWDHSPLLQKPFSIGTVPPGLPAEAALWRATPLSESIKAQLPRADWPCCLAKGGGCSSPSQGRGCFTMAQPDHNYVSI